MATPSIEPRTHRRAAKRRLASSSVAPVAAGYERSLRPSEARFSRPVGTNLSEVIA
jgi:hypothetical protein